jgi:hypothetical protein
MFSNEEMKISFFEEFPTDPVLEKLNLIDFPTRIYIAAHSLKELRGLEGRVKPPLVYWIVLKKWEGYWISPFTARGALVRTFDEVRREPVEVMLDLENPVHAPWQYVLGLPNFWRNKRLIQSFIDEVGARTTLVELPGNDKRLRFWGLSYDSEKASVVKMVYTSLGKGGRAERVRKLRRTCREGVSRYGNRFMIGLGCIAKGVSGIEPILSPDGLAEDLSVARQSGVQEAIIFRLDGLTKDYVRAIGSV